RPRLVEPRFVQTSEPPIWIAFATMAGGLVAGFEEAADVDLIVERLREVALKLPPSVEFTLIAGAWVIVLCDLFGFLFSAPVSAPSLRHFNLRFCTLGCVLHDGCVRALRLPTRLHLGLGGWLWWRWLWPKTRQQFLAHSVSFFFSEHLVAPSQQP